MKRREFLSSTVGAAAAGWAGRSHAASPKPGAAPVATPVDRDEILQIAGELIRIPSFTTEETQVAQFLHDFFRREGLESELQEVDPGRLQTIGRLRGGGGGKSLILNGHIDIDPLPAGIDRDPWKPTVEGDLLYGTGIANMKGGLAAMIAATLAVKRAGTPLRGDVVLACVVGELQGGAGTVHMLKSGVRADAAIVTEPIGAGTILTKHAGVMQLAVHVVGRSAHISKKGQGVNAILKMAKVVEALETLAFTGERDPELPSLPLINVGSIIGGRGREPELRGPNNVPDFCSAYADVRFTRGMTPETVIGDIRRTLSALARQDHELVYEIEFPMKPERRCLREVMMPLDVPRDTPFIQRLKAIVTEVSGKEPQVGVKLPISYGGTDTAHLFPAGIPACVYGPAGGRAEDYQSISIEEMVTCARVYAAAIEDFCS
jgi:acetylornithine deacetylase